MTILLTGATGYVGGRLLPKLVRENHRVRCLVRRPQEFSSGAPKSIEVCGGDVLKASSLAGAFDGVDTAYYLIHSMGESTDFVAEESSAAQNFADAAKRAGVKRVIYVGGLGKQDQDLSPHLQSRQRVGEILRSSGAEVIEFRASIVIGSGSLSFEMIRSLVEKLPVMICPKWVRVQSQPIGIEDLLTYLLEALEVETSGSRIFEIGGPDQVTYGQLMMEYARQRKLKRIMVPVPFLTPYLSSLWLGLVTPIYARVGRKLVNSLKNPTVVENPSAATVFRVRPRGLVDCIARALANEDREFAETRWSDALSSVGRPQRFGGVRFGSRLVDSRTTSISVPAETTFSAIRRIGGDRGWYYANWLWRIRGFLDLLVGGVGVRRGRRHGEQIRVGDAIDFWRVEAYEPNCRLRLRAEMKVPGRAWLEFEVTPIEHGCQLRQTAEFDPLGLLGIAYWYSLWPLHQFIFSGMLRRIAGTAAKDKETPNHV